MLFAMRFKKFAFIATVSAACFSGLSAQYGLAADSALTFEKLVEYLDLEVKPERILKSVNESSTAFTLGADQIKLLKSKGASDALIAAIAKKSAAGGQHHPAASDISDFVLILDCSGSMKDMTPDGKTKWDVAQQAALDLVTAVPNGRQLAFIAYGHNKEQKCGAVEVLRPLSPMSDKSRGALATVIGRLQPVGHTPIAVALQKAGEELNSASGLSKVVLITDGMETCNGNPVEEAKKLAANERLKGGLTVIGFNLNESEAAAVAQIAKAGNGEFFDAKKASDMIETVKVVGTAIAQADAKPAALKSDVKPSSDMMNPAPLELGKYVSGRLSEGRGHHFSLNLPAGEYVAIADVERGDRDNSNLIFNVQVDGKRIFSNSEIDRNSRGAIKFSVGAGPHVFTVENRFSIIDYHFGVYRADEAVPAPFIEHPAPPVKNYEPGSSLSFKLSPKNLGSRVLFLHTKLEPGDYDVTVTFRAPTAKGLYGVHLDTVNEYGAFKKVTGSKYGDGHFQTLAKKLIVGEDVELWFRLKCFDDAPIDGKFTITKSTSGGVQ